MSTKIDIYSGPPDRTDRPAFAEYVSMIMNAWAGGMNIHGRILGCSHGYWTDCGSSVSWNWGCYDYRVDPSEKPKKMRPWNRMEDVPDSPVVWIKFPPSCVECLIICIGGTGVSLKDNFYSWEKLINTMWSLDRKTWHKCEVEDIT